MTKYFDPKINVGYILTALALIASLYAFREADRRERETDRIAREERFNSLVLSQNITNQKLDGLRDVVRILAEQKTEISVTNVEVLNLKRRVDKLEGNR